jgi:mono/diheme cytochrome c family protein
MKSVIAVIWCLVLFPSFARGQEWIVPEEKRGRLSTFAFSDETRKEGEKLYTVNCMSCHGNPGKGNYLALVPVPGDPAKEKIQRNSDGEIFYKVTLGKGQMPSFRSVLSTDDIWKTVSYIRSFNKSYVQKVMQVITSSAYPGAMISMKIVYDASEHALTVLALAADEEKTVPVTGAGVSLLVGRYFGMLPVDDTAGNVRISAKFTDEEVFGVVSKDTVIKAGVITVPVSLVAQRAMWNNVRKAPVWIILAYTLGVLTVWGFIFLVMMKLRDIYTIGSALRGKLHDPAEPEINQKQAEI